MKSRRNPALKKILLACFSALVFSTILFQACTGHEFQALTAPFSQSNSSTQDGPAPVANTYQPKEVPTQILNAVGGNSVLAGFLIQDVCVNDHDEPIHGDPASCPRHRDLKFGEFIPFTRTDAPLASASRSTMAYPIQAGDGSLRIMYTFDFKPFRDYNGGGNGTSAFIDGGSIGEGNGAYASLMATQDAGGLQVFWNSKCGNEDSWMLFPLVPSAASTGDIPVLINIAPTCPPHFISGVSHWSSAPFTYTSGKTLDTLLQRSITTDANGNNIGDHIEITYFTREYGNTRWESWSMGATLPAQPGCNGPDHTDFGYGPMSRTFCSDLSFVTDSESEINPLTNPYFASFAFSRNLLISGDFASDTVGNWQQWTSGGQVTDWQLAKDTATANSYLSFACWSGCENGESIYQDVDAASLRGTLKIRFGALLKASKSAGARIEITLLGGSNQLLAASSLPQKVIGTTWQHVDGTLDWNFDSIPASKIRFRIYIYDKTTLYSADEAYLVPSRD